MGGERGNTTKLTVAKVHKIRQMYADKKANMKQLGKQLGVNEQTISKIINRKTWKYV
jgi:DNA-binding Xre family transcriptional regulator